MTTEASFAVWGGLGPDYEAACSVGGLAGLLRRPAGDVLVFGDEPLQTAVHRVGGALCVIRWGAAPSEEALIDVVEGMDLQQCSPQEENHVTFGEREVVVAEAAGCRGDGEDFLSLRVAPGSYRVRSFYFEAPEEVWVVIHQFDLQHG